MKLKRKLSLIFDHIVDSLAFLAAALVIVALLLVSSDVFLRYFLSRPITGALEINEYIVLFIPFLGAAWLLRRGGHMKIDLMLSRLNSRTQAMANAIIHMLGAMGCLVLAWYTGQVVWDNFQRSVCFTTILEVPTAPVLAVIPVGSFLLFVQSVRCAHGYLRSYRALENRGQGNRRKL